MSARYVWNEDYVYIYIYIYWNILDMSTCVKKGSLSSPQNSTLFNPPSSTQKLQGLRTFLPANLGTDLVVIIESQFCSLRWLIMMTLHIGEQNNNGHIHIILHKKRNTRLLHTLPWMVFAKHATGYSDLPWRVLHQGELCMDIHLSSPVRRGTEEWNMNYVNDMSTMYDSLLRFFLKVVCVFSMFLFLRSFLSQAVFPTPCTVKPGKNPSGPNKRLGLSRRHSPPVTGLLQSVLPRWPWWNTPAQVTVTARIVMFLVGDPNLNLHLPRYWEGRQPKINTWYCHSSLQHQYASDMTMFIVSVDSLMVKETFSSYMSQPELMALDGFFLWKKIQDWYAATIQIALTRMVASISFLLVALCTWSREMPGNPNIRNPHSHTTPIRIPSLEAWEWYGNGVPLKGFPWAKNP